MTSIPWKEQLHYGMWGFNGHDAPGSYSTPTLAMPPLYYRGVLSPSWARKGLAKATLHPCSSIDTTHCFTNRSKQLVSMLVRRQLSLCCETSKAAWVVWRSLHYLQRILPNCDISFAPLPWCLNKRFWPSVFGGQISKSEQHLFSLSTHLGGMGIFDPVELANVAYTTSRACTNMAVNAIKNNADFVVSS